MREDVPRGHRSALLDTKLTETYNSFTLFTFKSTSSLTLSYFRFFFLVIFFGSVYLFGARNLSPIFTSKDSVFPLYFTFIWLLFFHKHLVYVWSDYCSCSQKTYWLLSCDKPLHFYITRKKCPKDNISNWFLETYKCGIFLQK